MEQDVCVKQKLLQLHVSLLRFSLHDILKKTPLDRNSG